LNRFPHGDPDTVVRDVLSGAAYRHAPSATPSAPQHSLWAVLWTWLHEHVIGPLLSPLVRAFAHAAHGRLGALLDGGFVALALALLVLVAYRLALAYERASRDPRRGDAVVALAPSHDAAAWRARAREAAARNDFARAIAALFAAALALLDERAVIGFDPARTPGEYRRAVRRERELAANAFDELAQRFVRAVYARERPGADAYAEADRAFDRFEPATRA